MYLLVGKVVIILQRFGNTALGFHSLNTPSGGYPNKVIGKNSLRKLVWMRM